MRRAGSSFAKCSTGYRSTWAFLGLTVAAVISLFSRRGASRIRSASSSGSSGIPLRRLAADRTGCRERKVDQVSVDQLLGAGALVCLLYTSDAADDLLCVDL